MEPSLVIKDELTGLYNRLYLNKALEENLSLAQSEALPLAIILLDLELLTNINNHFDYLTGDLILQQVAELLKTRFRDSGIPCRYAVDEFLVILPNTSVDLAYSLSEELRLAIKSLEISSEQGLITLTASFGVACFPRQGETSTSLLLQAAERALDQAKRTDKLTGLYDIHYANKALEKNVNLAKLEGLSLAIILLNIDYLHLINGKYGLSGGDLVLQKVGELLNTTFRDSGIPCRRYYWSEGFLVILPNTSCESAYSLAEELRLAIKSLEISSEQGLITLIASSFGVAGFWGLGETVTSILEAAERALLKAQKAGGDRVCLAEVITDELTGLYNRRYLNKALEENLSLAKSEGLSLAIILLDLNLFGEFGNRLDHLTANFVLETIGELLKTTFRDSELLGRYGEDKFLVILPKTSRESAYSLTEELRLAIQSLEISISNCITTSGGVAGFPGQGETATSLLKAAERALYKPMDQDQLTGVYNNTHYLDKALQENLSLAKEKGLSMAIILLDLDYFKQINDRFGHTTGDLVLQRVGELLKTTFRDSGIPCRYGGDEFLVILPNACSSSAYERSEEVRLAIKSLKIYSEQDTITLTASVGVTCSEDGETVESILESAELALYEAKHTGRDRICVAEIPTTDHLTGLYNTRYANKALQENLSLAKLEGLSVILLDLDYFKKINDRFGHLTGDLVLQKVGELLKTTFRDSGIPCRYRKDKFLIILPLCINISSAYSLSEELRLAIKSLEIKDNAQTITLTASFGVACFWEQGETATSILDAAYLALLKAKSYGGDRVCLSEIPILTDELTRLYNRRYLNKVLEENLSLAKSEGLPFAIILLDLELFEQVKYKFGYPFGEVVADLVLQKIGKLLKTTFRDNGIPCCYGEDTFLIILPNTSRESAYYLAEELRLAIKSLEMYNEQGLITLIVPFGVACFPEHGETVKSLLNSAVRALYQAIMTGRDRVCIAEKEKD